MVAEHDSAVGPGGEGIAARGSGTRLLADVERACRLRVTAREFCDIEIESRLVDRAYSYLIVHMSDGPFARPVIVAVLDGTPTIAIVDRVRKDRADLRIPEDQPSELVYTGNSLVGDVERYALAHRVRLQPFGEYQMVWNPNRYLDHQARWLAGDPQYPLDRYVDKSWSRFGEEARSGRHSGVASEIIRSLDTPDSRFILVIGDFGTGKTFLTRHLVGAIPNALPHLVPVLVTMRELEKAHSLHTLVNQHMAERGEDPFFFHGFHYLLEQGRIALLVDGFDELATRVPYERVTHHFAALRSARPAAAGRGAQPTLPATVASLRRRLEATTDDNKAQLAAVYGELRARNR